MKLRPSDNVAARTAVRAMLTWIDSHAAAHAIAPEVLCIAREAAQSLEGVRDFSDVMPQLLAAVRRFETLALTLLGGPFHDSGDSILDVTTDLQNLLDRHLQGLWSGKGQEQSLRPELPPPDAGTADDGSVQRLADLLD
jgi:hypothetical protein